MATVSNSTSNSPRTGSETRRRNKRLLVRLDDRELAEIEAGANAAGLTLASYARQRILSGPARKPSRRASPDMALLAEVLGQLQRVGSSLNGIARSLKKDERHHLDDLPAALAVFRGTVVLVMRALGYRTDANHH
jgi:hypothetical protein